MCDFLYCILEQCCHMSCRITVLSHINIHVYSIYKTRGVTGLSAPTCKTGQGQATQYNTTCDTLVLFCVYKIITVFVKIFLMIYDYCNIIYYNIILQLLLVVMGLYMHSYQLMLSIINYKVSLLALIHQSTLQ